MRRLAALTVLLVLGGSCGGGDAKTLAAIPTTAAAPTTGITPSNAELASQFLDLGNQVNEAHRIFEEKQAAIFRRGTIGVAQYADLADALVGARTSIVRDLRSARESSVLRLEEVTEGMVAENMAASLADDLLRADLGLPPS